MFSNKSLILFISRFAWVLWSLPLFFNFVTSAILTNQKDVRSNQCHSNKTNVYTLSNQCSITRTVYLQNSTLIQWSKFLITIYWNQVFITLEIKQQPQNNDLTIFTHINRPSSGASAKTMTNFATDSHSNNKIRRWKSKQEFFFFLKKTRPSSLKDWTI